MTAWGPVQSQKLKDRSGMTIGSIETQPDGSLVIKDASGMPKGYYDPKTNVTKDRTGMRVGEGNLLTTLL